MDLFLFVRRYTLLTDKQVCSLELNNDLCGQVTLERSSESNVFRQLKMQFLH